MRFVGESPEGILNSCNKKNIEILDAFFKNLQRT